MNQDAKLSRAWLRDELVIAITLYRTTPFGKFTKQNADIVRIAEMIGRSPSSVAMKLSNFASLDPAHQSRGIKGLKHASKADGEIFQEFADDDTGLAVACRRATDRLGHGGVKVSDEMHVPLKQKGVTEQPRTVKARLGQELFRATVLASYDFSCAITGIDLPELLTASHIVPWAVDEQLRLDPRNGIALSALHDRAFDRGLIGIDRDFKIMVSSRLKTCEPSSFSRSFLLELEGHPIRLPSRNLPDPKGIDWHREHVFVH